MKTLAAILVEQKKDLVIGELEIPALGEGQVLVKVAYSGICQSQINEIQGHKGPDAYLPHTLGHEGSGFVVDAHPSVGKVKAGDPVVLSWIKGVGKEAPRSIYRWGDKLVNSGAISTFLEYAVIAENRLVPISAEMPLKEAALLGCAVPTGAGVIFNEMRDLKNKSIAIFGFGGIGQSAFLAAKLLGATPIIIVEIYPERMERARQMGADFIIDATKEDPLQLISEITKGAKLDYAFEAAGAKKAMENAFASIKNNGVCILAGNVPAGHKIEIDPFSLILGKKIFGSWGGSSQIERDIQYYTQLFLEKKLGLSEIITHQCPLPQINDLVKGMMAGKIGRGIIDLHPS